MCVPINAQVVANLPYNITTDTLKRLLPMGNTFSTVVLLVQEEARRPPHHKDTASFPASHLSSEDDAAGASSMGRSQCLTLRLLRHWRRTCDSGRVGA